MITETHARGFEFHAWLNPTSHYGFEYIRFKSNAWFLQTEWMIKYGGKYYTAHLKSKLIW
jgi:uncharacterized lipoprotein YddW (UPF0748 family)